MAYRKISQEEKKLIIDTANKRFYSKRNAGISSKRSDGSICTEQNDIDATGAEYFAAKYYNQNFNDTISVHGDDGWDFKINDKTIEVIWLGRDKKNGSPRTTGNLIVNPNEPKRWADIYLVIGGGFDEGYELIGWTDHESLIKKPKVDFGYGKKFAMHISELNKGPIY